MANKLPFPAMNSVAGFKLGTTCAGIKYAERRDLVVMELCEGATQAGVFTLNAFCAAPVTLAKQHLKTTGDGKRYWLVNTGNANAGTGEQGMQDAIASCEALAEVAGVGSSDVLPFSTGVIGENLPMDKLLSGIPGAIEALAENGWDDAAHGILTTDTVPKGASTQVEINGQTVTITGISKGSGMIRPNMATMLAYIATDASVDDELLQSLLQVAADNSFNRITIDGDTSTNDSCMLAATGKSAIVAADDTVAVEAFQTALNQVLEDLAKAIVLDGEGATKLIHIKVEGGKNEQECLDVAYTVAHSPLVKTAFFASDPNWGRILAAVGRAGLGELDLELLEIFLDDVCIVRHGGRAEDYQEAKGQAVMDKDEITITIELGRGMAKQQVWTCDFSYDYVKINAEYRT